VNFLETPIPGAMVIEADRYEDDRGFFARVYCEQAFRQAGLPVIWPQSSSVWNRRKGTLRGLHFQDAPHQEAKLVRCAVGRIFDVIVDLRSGSPTYRKWWGVELSRENMRTLFVPMGLAHGYQTLADDTEIHYMISALHVPGAARGIRWDDAELGIPWPQEDPVLSERDRIWPDLGTWHAGKLRAKEEHHD
jgi:dTDP-4-dehydrorhamnose 3,5-epimerase